MNCNLRNESGSLLCHDRHKCVIIVSMSFRNLMCLEETIIPRIGMLEIEFEILTQFHIEK